MSGAGSQLQAFFALRNNYVFVYALMMGERHQAADNGGLGRWVSVGWQRRSYSFFGSVESALSPLPLRFLSRTRGYRCTGPLYSHADTC